MSSRNNTFAALDTTEQPEQEMKWGETPCGEEETCPCPAPSRPSRNNNNNNKYNGNEQPKKIRFVTLREAVSRAFNRHPGIFGHAFDKQRPMIPVEEWAEECELTNNNFDLVEVEQARARLESFHIMEESLALSFVTPYVVDGLLGSVRFYENKASRARQLYDEAVDAANSRN